MAVVQIQMRKASPVKGCALFNLGFRPFFLGAGIFAIVSIVWWVLVYSGHGFVQIQSITNAQWHAHEMLYGYGLAVVAGFLLTAVRNWTGVSTPHGKPLMGLFALWVSARLLFLFGTSLMLWATIADLLFGLMLIIAISIPIFRAKQWPQLAVIVKVAMLWVGNIVFYLGYYQILQDGMLYAINGAVLLLIGLILMIGRRVIPFFIERGVSQPFKIKHHQWLDTSILVAFLALFINEIFYQHAELTPYLAIGLFMMNGYRLSRWHVWGIWRVPLLWSLYLSAWMINVGFLLYGLHALCAIPLILVLHLFTIGGIGLMSLAMMARVALGHTGRDIRASSVWLVPTFIAVMLSLLLRVFAPMFAMQFYPHWIVASALCWIIAFAIFVWIYAPILYKPRVDGSPG
ncbi:NnrS family protein [Methylotenera oryzisoli]|uniref:NnrS family protein n=1 Tax=Methylotenera oryzisoli TaxID=2080758 RepID=A0A4Y9VSU7_9PROT|nr:NnrS family protein [Methylotenera oryzisoli]TFW72365.1 NnrS family protein [Methylotenera oryzisoli]